MVSFIALFAIALSLNAVLATCSTSNSGFVTIDRVVADGVLYLDCEDIAVTVGNSIDIEVVFTANADVDNARVKVYTEGYKNDVTETSSEFRLVKDKTYVKKFTLNMPSSMDLDTDPENLALNVRVYAKDVDAVEKSYKISVQKESYSLDILSIESDSEVVAGDTLALDVVVENNGANRLDNVYVKASIPELGISKKVYFGDIEYTEDDNDEDINDAVEKTIYLNIPRNSIPGVYNIEVEASNYDETVKAKKSITVQSVEAGVIPTVTAKTVAIGGETEFELVLVNTNDRMVVYSITPGESEGLIVESGQSIVTVPADSSTTVKVRVKATESATEGTHLVTVNVNSESGLVRQVTFSANVEGTSSTTTNTVFVLTVVLAIVFVVLLIVLIVLLTKKPAETEEFGETSYY
ncbi:MAG: hypothetical protein WC438_04535 [Candidatus Pacearchaeota archaeon]